MTVSTSPPPQRNLPRHSERRRELVAFISEPARSSHGRWLVPATAAASVALVAAGAVLSAAVIRGQPASPTSTAPPVGGSPTSTSSPADSAKFLNPPPSHAMSAAEMSAAFADCVADSGGDWTAGFEPALGRVFDLNRSAPERTTRTWLVAHKLGGPFDDLMVCTKSDADPGYSIISRKSDTGTNIPYVRDLVEIHSEGFGRYTAPVATITAKVMLALALGLRRGEIVGLRWVNIDLDNRVIYVRRLSRAS